MSSKYAIDCEMVGSGNKSILARVSIVNGMGSVVLDTYVKPTAAVTDYRDFVTGVRKTDLANGSNFDSVRNKVSNILSGGILIGHSLHFDLEALNLTHPQKATRDLAKYEPFIRRNNGQPVALKTLAREYLGRTIQNGVHNSVEDAKACMDIYLKVAADWEKNYR